MMDFALDGAERHDAALSEEGCRELEELIGLRQHRPGHRLNDLVGLSDFLERHGITAAARDRIGAGTRPTRAIFLDKTELRNWSLDWHQDRTIAVAAKAEVPGFAAWNRKAGIVHVEPPFEFIERSLTARIHLDAVDQRNAPLRVIRGSHRQGRLADDQIREMSLNGETAVCLAERGDVWWYSTPIVHASKRADRARSRRVLQIDFSADQLPTPLEWRGVY
jgi:hypothetical protein